MVWRFLSDSTDSLKMTEAFSSLVSMVFGESGIRQQKSHVRGASPCEELDGYKICATESRVTGSRLREMNDITWANNNKNFSKM